MFKAVLVIFVLGVGRGHVGDGGSLTVTPFQSMEQCKEAVVHLEDVLDDWHYGNDKTDLVPVNKTAKCFPITAVPLALPVADQPSYVPECKPVQVVIPQQPAFELRKHKRWDR